MRRSMKFVLVVALVALALGGCVGSVNMSVPIGGSPWGSGPYGSINIGSGPIHW